MNATNQHEWKIIHSESELLAAVEADDRIRVRRNGTVDEYREFNPMNHSTVMALATIMGWGFFEHLMNLGGVEVAAAPKKPRLPRHGETDYEHCPLCNAPSRGMGGYWCDHPGVGDDGWKSTAELDAMPLDHKKPMVNKFRLQPCWVEYYSISQPHFRGDKKGIVILHLKHPRTGIFDSLKSRGELTEANGFFPGEVISSIGPGKKIAFICTMNGDRFISVGTVDDYSLEGPGTIQTHTIQTHQESYNKI